MNGFFLLEAEPNNDGYLFEYITLRNSSDKPVKIPVNFDIIYKSDWVKGEDARPYGLVVANSDENKYFFQTNNEGKSKIEGTRNHSNEPFKIAYDLGKVFKKNDYKVEVRDRTATYYINSNKIGTCELNNSLSDSCKIGFMVYDKQKVIFYDFQIIEQ